MTEAGTRRTVVAFPASEGLMATQVTRDGEHADGFVRRKTVSVRNDGSMRSVIDCAEFGTFTTDEPQAHGG
ncbi:MAG: hypothetical protein GEV11_24160, partial [Streptosporangiales bacterium]|nr:hypothetical protein [Streptosporangiales bacterium]